MFKTYLFYIPEKFSFRLVVSFDYMVAIHNNLTATYAADAEFSPSDPVYAKREHIMGRTFREVTAEFVHEGALTKKSLMEFAIAMYDDVHMNYDIKRDEVLIGEVYRSLVNLCESEGLTFKATESTPVSELAKACPGMFEVVSYPRGSKFTGTNTVYQIIQHLNDHDKWTREQIADWLESLDVDLSIKTEE